MVTIKPFPALLPKPDLAAHICELPYDVMSSQEARELAAGNPWSFLHVSKPEIDLPLETDPHDGKVYAQGAFNFAKLLGGALQTPGRPHFFLYRQSIGSHSQLGLVAVASCDDYLKGVIKKHELTRPDKEDDRVRHIEALNAQTGPAWLFYRSQPALDAVLQQCSESPPWIDFTAKDGVRHSAWILDDAVNPAAIHHDAPTELSSAGSRSSSPTEGSAGGLTRFIESSFARLPCLYIADGHHRTAAAARVSQTRHGQGTSGFFLSVIFPHDQLKILPYNRVLKDLNGLTAPQLLAKLEAVFVVRTPGAPQPRRKHELGLYLENRWHELHFRPHFAATSDPFEKLDVTLLQKYVLAAIFGIDDPRTSKRINFVGGIRGTAELEKLVNSGEYACAFSMFPTSVGDLMAVADRGGIMPPKSTWFEPKLRDGMFCHRIL